MYRQIKTKEELIREVVLLYRNSRKTKYFNNKIFRGRSRSISSYFEDLFANFLSNNINCDQIYIDQPLTVDGIKGRSIYPDIVIVKNNRIIALLDVKTDLGFNRYNFYELCRKDSQLIKLMKGKNCSLIVGETKEKKYGLIISRNLIYDIVILSRKNNKNLEKQILRASRLNPKINVFVLTDGKHPNTYNVSVQKLIKGIKINETEFNKMVRKIS